MKSLHALLCRGERASKRLFEFQIKLVFIQVLLLHVELINGDFQFLENGINFFILSFCLRVREVLWEKIEKVLTHFKSLLSHPFLLYRVISFVCWVIERIATAAMFLA